MAAIDFPASPTVNQLFSAANGVTYQWNGTLWLVQAGNPGPVIDGYLYGLTLSNNGTTGLNVGVGKAADSTNATLITNGSSINKLITATWAAGTAAGGRGTGVSLTASTWYHLFGGMQAGAFDAFYDTSFTGANKPAAFTSIRRLGSIRTDGSSNIIAFRQFDNEFLWVTPVLEGTTFPVSPVTVAVPPGSSVQWIGNAQVIAVAGSSVNIVFSDFGVTPGQGFTWSASAGGSSAQPGVGAQARVWTNTSSQLVYAGLGSGLGFSFWTQGWVDTRGRFG